MKKLNRILSMLLAVIIAICMLPTTVFAEDTKTYLAIGDSISTGYGLTNPNTESFTALFAGMLGKSYSYVNKAENGETTVSLSQKLTDTDFRAAVAKADVITLTIGGNDLMNLLYEFLADNMDLEPKLTADGVGTALASGNMDVVNAAAQAITTKGFTINDNDVNGIREVFEDLTEEIQKLNSDAILIVADQYNPYAELAGVIESYKAILSATEYATAAEAILELNEEIEKALVKWNNVLVAVGCVYAPVWEAFNAKGSGVCNAGLTIFPSVSVNLDIHPNLAGHKLISEQFWQKFLTVFHSHCVCGGVTDIGDHTTHSNIPFTPWYETDSMPTQSGNYVLMNDVTVSEAWRPDDNTVLCLNGNDLILEGAVNSVIAISGNNVFTLCDCSLNPGKITGGKNAYGGGVYIFRSQFNMYNGVITGNSAESGGGVFNDESIFNMYGGKIYGNTAESWGGGVYHDRNTSQDKMTLFGNATIIDNFLENGADSNLHVGTHSSTIGKVTVSESFSGSVGISMYEYGVFSIGGKSYANNFFADNSDYMVAVEGDNLKLIKKPLPTLDLGTGDAHKYYDGQPIADPTEGELIITGAQLGDVKFTWKYAVEEYGTIVEGDILENPPVDAGAYWFIASIEDGNHTVIVSDRKRWVIEPISLFGGDVISDKKVTRNPQIEQRIELPELPTGVSYVISAVKFSNSSDNLVISDHFSRMEVDGNTLIYSGKETMTLGDKYDVIINVDSNNYSGVIFVDSLTVIVCNTASGEHEYTVPQKDGTYHWNKCCGCDAIDSKVKHSGNDDGDCTTAINCSVCNGITEEARFAHSGGTATCTAKARCEICGKEYGEPNGHGETEIRNAKPASCSEEGYTGDTYCKICGEKLEDGNAIARTAHTYKNGKCTACDAENLNQKTVSPQTGNNFNMWLLVALMFVSGAGLTVITVFRRNKRTV